MCLGPDVDRPPRGTGRGGRAVVSLQQAFDDIVAGSKPSPTDDRHTIERRSLQAGPGIARCSGARDPPGRPSTWRPWRCHLREPTGGL